MTGGGEDIPLVCPMMCIAVPGLGGREHTSLGIKAESNYEWSPVHFPHMTRSHYYCQWLPLTIYEDFGEPLHNNGFLSSKKYKIFGICTLTSSCNNVFYYLEKEEVNPCDTKVMKVFSDFYGYMWRCIWHFPFLKGFFFLWMVVRVSPPFLLLIFTLLAPIGNVLSFLNSSLLPLKNRR